MNIYKEKINYIINKKFFLTAFKKIIKKKFVKNYIKI